MRPEIKLNGTEYYKYALIYVDDVLVISCVPTKTIEVIKCIFKLKVHKAEPPDMYLGASLEQIERKGVTKCWSMSDKRYAKAAAVNLEATLAKRDMRLPTSNYQFPTN